MIDEVCSYDGLHPQKKKGHHWSVIQSELNLISDKRTLGIFSVCVQLSKSLTLLIICFFGFVNDTDDWTL